MRIIQAVTVFIGKVLCDAPTLESKAYSEGLLAGYQVACDQMAEQLHTTEER